MCRWGLGVRGYGADADMHTCMRRGSAAKKDQPAACMGGAGNAIHGPIEGDDEDNGHSGGGGVLIGRLMGGVEYTRPLAPRWMGGLRVDWQRTRCMDAKGQPIMRDQYGSPLTFASGNGDVLLAATVSTSYRCGTGASQPGSSRHAISLSYGSDVLPACSSDSSMPWRPFGGAALGMLTCLLICAALRCAVLWRACAAGRWRSRRCWRRWSRRCRCAATGCHSAGSRCACVRSYIPAPRRTAPPRRPCSCHQHVGRRWRSPDGHHITSHVAGTCWSSACGTA